MYNVEMTNGQYCCCDNPLGPCEERAADLRGRCSYADVCLPYFFVHIKRCLNSTTCLNIQSYRLKNRSNLALDRTVLYMPIDVESGENVKKLESFQYMQLNSYSVEWKFAKFETSSYRRAIYQYSIAVFIRFSTTSTLTMKSAFTKRTHTCIPVYKLAKLNIRKPDDDMNLYHALANLL